MKNVSLFYGFLRLLARADPRSGEGEKREKERGDGVS